MSGDASATVTGVDTSPQHQCPGVKAVRLVMSSLYHASHASVCVCLTLCLPCSSVSSASHRHPDSEHQPWLCPSLLAHSLRPRKEDT